MGFRTKLLSYCRILFCICNNFYAVPVYFSLFLLLQPLRLVSPRKFWVIEGWVFEKLVSMVGFWAQLSGHKIYMSGDDVSSLVDDESIVISNHQSTGDVPLMMYTLRGIKHSLRDIMWIMDWILQFTSFGWIAKCHGDCFILQGSDIRKYSFLLSGTEEEIKARQGNEFKRHLNNVYKQLDRKWMVLFPEGGFLHKRREGSQRYCRKMNLPILEHVALPRVGAMRTILEEVGIANPKSCNHEDRTLFHGVESVNGLGGSVDKSIKWIIDVTIGYPNGEPATFLSWITGIGGPKSIYVHFKVHHASESLHNKAGGDGYEVSDQWLYDKFIDKEKLLKDFYLTGNFPTGKLGMKEMKCFTFQTLIGHLFCLTFYAVIAWMLF